MVACLPAKANVGHDRHPVWRIAGVLRSDARRSGGVLAQSPQVRVAAGPQAIHRTSLRYPGRVTKRLIEVDDDKLEAVRSLLGTRTLKATVDDAFNEVLALAQRRRALLAEHGVETEALADPAARRDAWG